MCVCTVKIYIPGSCAPTLVPSTVSRKTTGVESTQTRTQTRSRSETYKRWKEGSLPNKGNIHCSYDMLSYATRGSPCSGHPSTSFVSLHLSPFAEASKRPSEPSTVARSLTHRSDSARD